MKESFSFKYLPDHTPWKFAQRTVAAQLHLLALLCSVLGLIYLLFKERGNPEPLHFWACLIFGLTSILVFAASSVYHFFSDGLLISNRLRKLVKDIDHASIFLFIAGTYTPFIVNVIQAPWQNILLVLIWTLGITGVAFVLKRHELPPWAANRFVYTALFLAMGWTIIIRMGEVMAKLTNHQMILLVAGGLSYTIGAVVYALKWPNPIAKTFGFHEIWHIMVIGGYAFHYFLILNFYT